MFTAFCVPKTYISIHAFFILKFITSCQKSKVNSWERCNVPWLHMCNQGTLQPGRAVMFLDCTSRQDKTAILGEILPIFRLFSAYFLPMVPHPTFLSPHVYRIHLSLPISIYFLPIFLLKWYPILAINSSMEPICCFSTLSTFLTFSMLVSTLDFILGCKKY